MNPRNAVKCSLAFDRYGRRLTIVVNALLFTAGALIIAARDGMDLLAKG